MGGEGPGKRTAGGVVNPHTSFSPSALAVSVLACGSEEAAARHASVGTRSGDQLTAGARGGIKNTQLEQSIGANIVVVKPPLLTVCGELAEHGAGELAGGGEVEAALVVGEGLPALSKRGDLNKPAGGTLEATRRFSKVSGPLFVCGRAAEGGCAGQRRKNGEAAGDIYSGHEEVCSSFPHDAGGVLRCVK